MAKSSKSKPVFVFATIILCIAAFLLLTKGFKSIEQIRQFERIPETSIETILYGETSVRGIVEPITTLKSPHTSTPSVYYRFLHEKETTNSDGDTKWKVLDDHSKAADFTLKDDTGRIHVSTLETSTAPILWSMPRTSQQVQGGHRYTEWIIAPQETIHIFGLAQTVEGETELTFNTPGQYSPIVSTFGPQYERHQMGKQGVFLIWGGLVAIAFAVFCAVCAFKIHRIIVYLSILSAVLTLTLMQLGIGMLSQDIKSSLERLSSQFESVEAEFDKQLAPFTNAPAPLTSTTFAAPSASNSELTKQLDRLSKIKVNLAWFQAQLSTQLTTFPDNIIHWLIRSDTNTSILTPIPLSPDEAVLFNQKTAQFQKTALTETWVTWAPFAAFFVVLITCYGGLRAIRFKRFIESIPTSKISGVAFGLTEIKGLIKYKADDAFIETPFSSKPCVWYYYKKEERKKSGKNDKWVTLTEERKGIPFLVSDRTGSIPIDSKGAEVITTNQSTKTQGNYRYTERYLKTNQTLYVIGSATLTRTEQLTPTIAAGEKSDPFILSNLPEEQVMLRKARKGMILLNIAFSALMFAVLLQFGAEGELAPHNFLIAALAAPSLMLVIMIILHFNDLVFLRQRVARNKSNIDVALQKRFELIGNLVTLTKQYMSHEKSLLTSIINLRQEHSLTAPEGSSQPLTKQFKLIGEQYPELKSHELIQQLMTTVTDLEDELAMMKKGFLDSLEIYNARTQTFPDIILAKIFGFKEQRQ